MTYFVYALTNDTARLMVKKMSTNDQFTADAVADIWASEGYIVVTENEG